MDRLRQAMVNLQTYFQGDPSGKQGGETGKDMGGGARHEQQGQKRWE